MAIKKVMDKTIKWIVLCVGMSLLSGCANEMTGYSYSAGDARRVQSVDYGRITRIQMVKIEGSQKGLGALGGAAAGGVAGSSVGKGNGSLLGAVGGAIIGGLAGNAIEKSTTSRQGINLFVRLCSGKTISVVQQIDKNNALREGDPVAILSNGNETRVTYDPDARCQNENNPSQRERPELRGNNYP